MRYTLKPRYTLEYSNVIIIGKTVRLVVLAAGKRAPFCISTDWQPSALTNAPRDLGIVER